MPAYPAPGISEISEQNKNESTLSGVIYAYPPPEAEILSSTLLLSFSHYVYMPLIYKPLLTYNRVNAVNWADKWAKSRPPCFPNYGEGSNCNDCTNYLSQVLFAGGLPTILNPNWDIRAWWYWCDEIRGCTNSNTWSSTDWMNNHVSQLQGVRFERKSSASQLSAGDFLIMDLLSSPVHGIPNHARVIVGWGYVQEGDLIGSYGLLANQHCTDRYRVRWNYNLGGNDLIWYWHVLDWPNR